MGSDRTSYDSDPSAVSYWTTSSAAAAYSVSVRTAVRGLPSQKVGERDGKLKVNRQSNSVVM